MDLEVIVYSVILIAAGAAGWTLFLITKKKLRLKEKESRESLQELTRYRENKYKYELENRDIYLNPHILKNTLNAIRNYAFKTHLSLDKLGGVMDYILYESKVNFTSLKEEMTFIMDFIELNKFRLNPLLDFRVSFNIDENDTLYTREIILPLITVDFIENAFRHGDLSGENGFIHINLKLDQQIFQYEVVNAINPRPVISASKGGLGQKKLKERLDLIYGDASELAYYQKDDVYKAELKLNLHEINRKMHITG